MTRTRHDRARQELSETEMSGTRPTHQSLRRAVAILRTFSEIEPELTVGDISRRLDLHKSTTSRILGTLAEDGLVWHNQETGRYSLGMALVELAGVALGQIDVRAAAMPHMEALGAEVDETVFVSILRGSDAVTVAHLPPRRSVRHVVWIGRRTPLRTTASGKTFLAAIRSTGQDWREVAWRGAYDVESVGSDPEMDEELDEIARLGLAVEVDDFEIGSSAIAAPIMDPSGAVVAAISIGAPTSRFGPEERDAAAPLLRDAARKIEAELGVRHERTVPAGAA